MSEQRKKLIAAAERADWMQVVLNEGPPCFHLEDSGRFCLRAERWAGHVNGGVYPEHTFIPLHALLSALPGGEAAVPAGWQPYYRETPPIGDVFFWVIPKHPDEAYTDTSGRPITPFTRDAKGHLHRGKWGTWGACEKATHWMPLPSPPAASAPSAPTPAKEQS